METENKTTEVTAVTENPAAEGTNPEQGRGQFRGGQRGQGRGGQRGPGGRGRREDRGERDEFDTRVLKIRRVSRMYHGGRRLRFSALVIVGDHKGQVAISVAKGLDAGSAQRKAISRAKKNLSMVQMKGVTIPHEVTSKYKSSIVLIRPAAPGTGLVAGATVKAILDLAGIKDALTKVMGSTNQINVAYATIQALNELRSARL